MLYTSAFHPLEATLRAFAVGSYYAEPFTAAKVLGGVTVGATYVVDGFVWSNTPVQSPDVSPVPGNQPGPDSVWWHAKSGGWIPDALLVTTAVPGAPVAAFPASEPVAQLFDAASGRYIAVGASSSPSMAQVDQEIASKLSGLKSPAHAHHNDGADPASALTGQPV